VRKPQGAKSGQGHYRHHELAHPSLPLSFGRTAPTAKVRRATCGPGLCYIFRACSKSEKSAGDCGRKPAEEYDTRHKPPSLLGALPRYACLSHSVEFFEFINNRSLLSDEAERAVSCRFRRTGRRVKPKPLTVTSFLTLIEDLTGGKCAFAWAPNAQG
jgi:hypothetical protein